MAAEILIDRATLNKLVHDRWWFDVQEVEFDSAGREFRLHAGLKRRGPYDQYLLKVTGVQSISVDDPVKNRIYCIHEIDVTSTAISIASFFPVIEITLETAGQARIFVTDLKWS